MKFYTSAIITNNSENDVSHIKKISIFYPCQRHFIEMPLAKSFSQFFLVVIFLLSAKVNRILAHEDERRNAYNSWENQKAHYELLVAQRNYRAGLNQQQPIRNVQQPNGNNQHQYANNPQARTGRILAANLRNHPIH